MQDSLANEMDSETQYNSVGAFTNEETKFESQDDGQGTREIDTHRIFEIQSQ